MKRAVASIIAVALLVGFSLWWYSYVHRVVGVVVDSLQDSLTAIEGGDLQAGLDGIIKSHELWEQADDVLALFLSHNIVDNIDVNCERVQSLLEQGDKAMAITELKALRHLIYNLQDNLEVSLRNIF